ncbi:MAG: c-type cytochrome [Aggregatilineales bacterium]
MIRSRLASLVLLALLAACGRADVVVPVTPTVFVPAGVATATAQAEREAVAATQAAAEPAAAQPRAAQAVAIGDADRGRALFNELKPEAGFACSTCHRVDSNERLIGPGLKGVSAWAAQNITNQTPQEYLRESIVNPNAYIVEGNPPYPQNLMPQIYGELFTPEQINDLVAYLMTL